MGPIEQALREARERVKRGWCRGAYARNNFGIPVSTISKDAAMFCSLGAMSRPAEESVLENDARALVANVVGDSVVAWNDAHGRTQEHVIAAFGLSIAVAKRRGI